MLLASAADSFLNRSIKMSVNTVPCTDHIPNLSTGVANNMSVNTVPCTVKPTVTLQIGDTETDSSRPGVYVIDVTLPIGQTVNVSQ